MKKTYSYYWYYGFTRFNAYECELVNSLICEHHLWDLFKKIKKQFPKGFPDTIFVDFIDDNGNWIEEKSYSIKLNKKNFYKINEAECEAG